MSLVEVIVALVVIGLVMWAINTYIPMSAAIKNLLNVVVIVIVVVWLLQSSGLIGEIDQIKIR